VSGGSGGSGAATAIGTTATVTVTNATTAPPVTATTTLTRTRTSTVTETATPTDAGQGGAPAGQGLGPGSQGPAVTRLQLELAQLGLYQGGPSGNYDQQTQAAVQNFQARAGITADPPGVAGPTTRQALNQAVGR
jgi:peptidoglycan hydrolase-like protein with peptidoglycan-binding domain